MSSIKAVIFDVDGVLLDSFDANLKFFQDLMKVAGYPPPKRSQYKKNFHMSMWDAIKDITKLDSEEDIMKIWNLGKNGKVKPDVSMFKVPKNVENVLEKLSKSYKLAIVTSRIKIGIYGIPKLAELKKYFEIAVSYEDTLNHKPHPEPLFLAAKQLDVNPDECVYIGDSATDIIAAKAAGMKIIAYYNKNLEANAFASSFKEIPDLVKSL